MIVPMKHVTLLCVENDKKTALSELARLGIMHVEEHIQDSEEILASRNAVEDAKRALLMVKTAAPKADWQQLPIKESTSINKNDPTFIGEINRAANEYATSKSKSLELLREITQYEGWGDFDLETAGELAKSGLEVKLFIFSLKSQLPDTETGLLYIVGTGREGRYGVAVGTDIPEEATFVAMPRKRLSAIKTEYATVLDSIKKSAAILSSFNDKIDNINLEIGKRQDANDYAAAFDNMPETGTVAYLTGFIDARREKEIVSAAKQNNWGVVLREPETDEIPPTLLEPPAIFRPVLALFKSLGITPGYNEADVSIPFFLFFSIFFAMLVGDAGYGAIILALTFYAQHKVSQASRSKGRQPSQLINSWIKMLYVFSGSTILYGVLGGTCFGTTFLGISEKYIPEILKHSMKFLSDQDYMMQLCFALGAVHLSTARIWNALVLWPSKKLLAELGWVGVVWSMYLIVCGIVMDVAKFTYPAWGPYLLVISIILIALFMLDKSELKTEGISLAMLPLDLMSSLGDVISYVRLYAVGLASVKLAENFNSMALGMDLPMLLKIPVMILIMGFGHGLNLAMAALSILVHGVRLNTLEFSSSKGVSWSGYDFKPFTAVEPAVAELAGKTINNKDLN